MKKPKILVVGSFVMDQIGITEVIPKEGETVLGKEFKKAPGGKGANQAVQAARLGAEVTMVGKVGMDANGAEMISVCKEAGIHTEHILTDPDTASGCSMLTLLEVPGAPVNNRIIVIPGANMKISIEDVSFLKDEIDQYEMVMLQLEIPMVVNEFVAALAYEHHVPVMLNSAPSAPLSKDLLSHLAYISPNEHEAQDLTACCLRREDQVLDMEAVKEACQKLRADGVENVIITLGGDGAALMNDRGFFLSPSVEGTTVVDPTAAGDSFVGAFCYAKASGMGDEEALRFSNHTASITVSRMGAMPSLPVLKEVLAYMSEKGQK